MQDSNADVALHAAEFWRLFSEYDTYTIEATKPHLKPLISTLLKWYEFIWLLSLLFCSFLAPFFTL
jgi:hypothetical protein